MISRNSRGKANAIRHVCVKRPRRCSRMLRSAPKRVHLLLRPKAMNTGGSRDTVVSGQLRAAVEATGTQSSGSFSMLEARSG
jgi:hypothetical protein